MEPEIPELRIDSYDLSKPPRLFMITQKTKIKVNSQHCGELDIYPWPAGYWQVYDVMTPKGEWAITYERMR